MIMDVPAAYMDHKDSEDLDTDDDFNSISSTFVDLEATPDDNPEPRSQSLQPPPAYQPPSQPNQSTSVSQQAPRTPLCTVRNFSLQFICLLIPLLQVCHSRPVYSTEGRQFTTCGLACASKVSMCRVSVHNRHWEVTDTNLN